MIDQFLHFLGEVTLSLPQPHSKYFSQAHFIPINFILMEPDATLWLLCVVVLEIEAERFVACAGGAHDKGPSATVSMRALLASAAMSSTGLCAAFAVAPLQCVQMMHP